MKKKFTSSKSHFLFLLLILTTACISNERAKEHASLTVIHEPEASVVIEQPNIIGDPNRIASTKSTDDQVLFQINLNRLKQFTIIAPEKINLLLQPGDSLVVDLRKPAVNFRGKGAMTNERIYQLDQMLLAEMRFNKELMDQMIPLSPKAYLELLDARNDSLKSYFSSNRPGDLDDLAAAYGESALSYVKAFRLYNYIVFREDVDTQLLKDAALGLLPLKEKVAYFPWYLNQFAIIYTYLEVIMPLQKREIFEPTDQQLIGHILAFDKDPLLQQAMLVSVLDQMLTTFSLETYKEFQPAIDSVLTMDGLKQQIADMYRDAQEHLQADMRLTSQDYTGDFDLDQVLDELLIKNKGKIIYLDIWATWCRPCIEEFKISRSFKSNFKDEEVTFIYLCARSPNQEAWAGLINQYQLEGIHLYLNDDQFAALSERYPVGYFPSNYIIDQQGEVVNQVANLSPSNPETIRLIKKLLEN